MCATKCSGNNQGRLLSSNVRIASEEFDQKYLDVGLIVD